MKNKNSKKKTKSAIKFYALTLTMVVVTLIGAFGFTFGSGEYQYRIKSYGERIGKGLDLVGGLSVLLEAEGGVESDTLDRTISLIDERLNKMGVSETTVTKEGDKRIRVEIPGKSNTNEVIDTIGKTGKLSFKDSEGNEILTGSDVEDAYATYDEQNKAVIALQFNTEGTKKFAEATKNNIGKTISISMDEEELTNPTVNSEIKDGKATITGSMTFEEATKTANLIKSGALPVTIKVAESKTIDSTLGQSALPTSVKAGTIGVALIVLFMVVIYKRVGIISSIALLLYIILLFFVFLAGEVTLSLAGIAGLLLTIGMAVDANVLIFERIKEELRAGKSIKFAVDLGYKRALTSILDSQITSIIVGIILYVIGTGAVKGFALTLIMGLVISIFTALTVTLKLIHWGFDMGFISKNSHFGVKEGKNI